MTHERPELGCIASTAQVQFSPDGRWLVSASFDKAIKLWDGLKGTFAATLRAHVGPVYQVAWSSDSRLFVSGSKDSTLKVSRAAHLVRPLTHARCKGLLTPTTPPANNP